MPKLPGSLAFTLLFLFAAVSAFSQTAQITGVVTDPHGAVVVGAAVSLTSSSAHATISGVTNGQGVYLFSSLAPGEYTLSVQAKGFTAGAAKAVVAAGQNTVTQNFALALEQNVESVQVLSGTVENAYRVENVAPGSPLGTTPILNLPYTLNVISRQLIDDTQSRNFKEAAKYLPLISFQEMQGPEVLRPESRGMQGTNMQDDRKDGMGIAVTTPSALEEYEQLEVFNGLGGSMYGPTSPSGIFNFVTKRPTEEPMRELEAQYEGATVATIHTDLGGRVGPNRIFGYRVNGVLGDGTGYVSDSQLRRQLAAVALDVRPFAHTVIEGNFSYYTLYQHGYPGWFAYNPVIYTSASSATTEKSSPYTLLPVHAPNPTQRGYGQSFSGVDLNNQIGEVRVKHEFGPQWHLIAGVLHQLADRNINTAVNSMTNAAPTTAIDSTSFTPSTYTSYLANEFSSLAPRFEVDSDLGYLTGHFLTGKIVHDVVLGSTGYRFASWSPTVTPSYKTNPLCPSGMTAASGTACTVSATLSAPLVDVAPVSGLLSYQGSNALTHGIYVSSSLHQQGFNLADTIGLTHNWLVRLAASQDWYWTNNYSAPSATNSTPPYTGIHPNTAINIDTQGVSPTASLIFKPAPNMSIYGTFAESLQAPDTPVLSTSSTFILNSGKALAPYHDNEGEIGYKYDSHKINFSTAMFRLQRPFANTVAAAAGACTGVAGYSSAQACDTYQLVGNQVNKGIEAMASGRIVPSLMITGGVTVLDPRLTSTGNAATNNKWFVGIPGAKSNILAEYQLPLLSGAFLNFDWQHTGRRPEDDINTVWVPQFNTFDLGGRYSAKIFGRLATWRATVSNVSNVHYWSTLGPGSITGQATGSYLGHLGEPRLVTASVRYDF